MSGQPGLFLPEFSVDPEPPSPGGLTAYDRGPWDIPLSGPARPAWPEPTLFGFLGYWGSWLRGAQEPLITVGVPQAAGHRQEFFPNGGGVTCTPRPGHWGTPEGAGGQTRPL